MLGIVNYVTPDINNQPWNLELSGLDFEDYISSVIEYALVPYYSRGLTVERTPQTRDQGKDLIIRSSIPFSLFGRDFSLRKKDRICVYIEFKSSKSSKISLDKFSKNLLLANKSEIDYFVLITNTSIVPFSYYEACRNAQENGYIFYLVDQYKLVYFLKGMLALHGEYCAPEDVSAISINYQVDFGKQNGRPFLELYLLFRNNTDTPQICRFQLKSDRNWLLSETEFEVFLEAGDADCRCIGVTKENFDGIDEILVRIDYNDEIKNVTIRGDALDYDFETPLVGEQHKEIITQMIASIQANTKIQLINLQGEAGIGKSRIISEITKRLCLNGIEQIHYTCTQSLNETTTDMLVTYLSTQFPDAALEKLSDILRIPLHFKRYVIVIEDIHNADKEFFASIKAMAKADASNTPFTIIIAGRDDYTVYNESYFSFLSWLKDDGKSLITSYSVPKLTDNECKNMIRAIIQGAPEIVVDRIYQASESNPFYVSQFIEYLLETKLIYLLNRNTVGIENVSTFCQKVYIPDSIEALLNDRFNIIADLPSGKQLQTFLLLLSLYGIEAPKHIYHQFFFDSNYSDAAILYKNHFLRLTNENNIAFDHENIFLFLRQKLRSFETMNELATVLIARPNLLKVYPDIQQAAIYFCGNEFVACKELLGPAISEIREIKNISSCNLNPKYADGYPIIYGLAKNAKDTDLQEKTLLAWLYIALHNSSSAKAGEIIDKVSQFAHQDHAKDASLDLTIKQMRAHFYLQSNRVSEAKRLLLELVAQERKNSALFDDQTRFDLFDRISSVYTQENHKAVAKAYNQLSYDLAQKLQDIKLLTLSKILAAKIEFYSDTQKALALMIEAQTLLGKDMSPRINCHNDFGILTAQCVLNFSDKAFLRTLLQQGKQLLAQATEIEYPGAIIRGHYLLAVLYYITATSDYEIEQAKVHIEMGITDSIRNGIVKLMSSFYCLLGIIAAREKKPISSIYQYFQTMLQHLRQCDQFFLGALDFTYSNIILLTNHAVFLCEYGLESEVYRFLREITYYGSTLSCNTKNCQKGSICFSSCQKNMDVFRENYKDIAKGRLLFIGKKYQYSLRDTHTPFFIPLGV